MNEYIGKRPATEEETEAALILQASNWNNRNPQTPVPTEEWRAKQTEAIAEGYQSEVCGLCGVTFLAFHHYTFCSVTECPMKSGTSLLTQILGETK